MRSEFVDLGRLRDLRRGDGDRPRTLWPLSSRRRCVALTALALAAAHPSEPGQADGEPSLVLDGDGEVPLGEERSINRRASRDAELLSRPIAMIQ